MRHIDIMSRRTRLIALIAGIPALLIVAALIAVYVMLQPQRFTATLRGIADNAGLELSLAAPAQPSLWPRPSVVLKGVTLTAKNSQAPVLLATRVRLIVPWHTVLGGKTAISALELDAPRVDLGALRQVLARQASHTGKAATLPTIDAGITMHNGSLVQDDTLLANRIELHTGALHPGAPFELDASAHTRSGPDYSFQLRTTPQRNASRIDFQPLTLTLGSSDGMHMRLHGKADWAGGTRIRAALQGKLKRASGRNYALSLATTPATTAQPMQLHLKAQGKGLHANLRLPPVGLVSWWKQVTGSQVTGSGEDAGAPVAPPVTGTLQADKLQVGSVSISGLQLQSGPDVPATAGSSAKTAPAKAGTP